LALLANTVKTVGDLPAAQQPQVFFVSVDAKRDTPEVLNTYVKHFDPSFVGVTGTQANLDDFTASLGVPSAIRLFDNGSYAVDHYAGVLAFNPQGELRALFSAPLTAEGLANDYRSLVGAQR
jgi:protein SCO1/2